MNDKFSRERIKELEGQQKQALGNLVKLAEERKANGFEPWSDPDVVQGIIDNAEKSANKNEQSELKELITKAGAGYSGLMRHYVERADKLANADKVSESISSHTKLMTSLEQLFIAYADTIKYQIELLEGSPESKAEWEKLTDAMPQEVQSFKTVLDTMRQQHAVLYDLCYAWHP